MSGRATPVLRSPYASRRSRHACENCRRKKSKCPGERPACSVCTRLKQTCVYMRNIQPAPRDGSNEQITRHESRDFQTPPDSSRTSERLTAIEARLEQIAAGFGARQTQQSPLARPQSYHQVTAVDLEAELVSDGILLYFRNHCNQPYPLLNYRTQDPLSHRYDQIVLNAMLALTLRRSKVNGAHRHAEILVKRTWNLLTDAYRQFDFDVSYFQALCLLAQVDFAEGRADRARTQVALGLRLAQSSGWLDEPHYKGRDARQYEEIVYTLCMLDSMFTNRIVFNTSIPENAYRLPTYHCGPPHPEHDGEDYDPTCHPSSAQNFNIVGSLVQMMHTWALVIHYMSESLNKGSHPIWHHESSRTAILSRLLELEIPMEPHTYAFVGPVDRVVTQPNLIPYFRTWLFFQMLHSAIHCCMNHPFIIFIKARQHGSRVPLTFLQKAHKDSLIYASWITKNLTDMDAAGLNVLDPFLAYLVGIAATIHIEHSSSRDTPIPSSARQKTATCMAYLSRVSQVWPKVRNRISALEQLRSRVGNRSALNYVEDEYDGAVPVRSVRHVSMSPIDESLLWSIFDSSNNTLPDGQVSAEQAPESYFEQLPASRPVAHDSSYHAGSPISQSYASIAPPSIDDLPLAPLDPLSSDMNMTADWSLLGMPWLAYFPSDANVFDSH